MQVLVVNAGSSSLKLRLLDSNDALLAEQDLPASSGRVDEAQLIAALRALPAPDAIGHRIVHGGARYRAATRLDSRVLRQLKALTDLAPLHQPPALEAYAVVARALPRATLGGVLRHCVSCFSARGGSDLRAAEGMASALAAASLRFPWTLSCIRRAAHGRVAQPADRGVADRELPPRRGSLVVRDSGRAIDRHDDGLHAPGGFGHGNSIGQRRSGLLLWLLEDGRLHLGEMTKGLEHESGLLGLAGSADMRQVLLRALDNNGAATLALEVYVHRLRAAIASMAVALDRLDAIVFTGGVGERAASLRARTCDGLSLLGVALDAERNAASNHDQDIGASGARVRTLVISAREDLEIAREVRGLLSPRRQPVGG